MSHLAGQDEIKRSYRRLVSKYHPDINPDQNAHLLLVELNEAYEILSDPNTRWLYDQHVNRKDEVFIFEPEPVSSKRRRGKKETNEQKLAKKAFAKMTNRSFNRKMKVLSFITLILGGLIFADHYLPTNQEYQKVYASLKPQEIQGSKDVIVSVFLNKGKKIELYPVRINKEITALRPGEALFNNTPIFSIIESVQMEEIVFKPFDGLYNVMLVFGLVCLSSIFVLGYKLEKSLVLPTIITFFDNILILSFFTMWYMD